MDSALTCAQCGAATTGRRFCSNCGTPLLGEGPTEAVTPHSPPGPPSDADAAARSAVAAPAVVVPTVSAPVATLPWLQEAAPAQPRSRPNVLAVLVVAALALSAWAIVRGVEEHTLSGSLLLVDSGYGALAAGRPCSGEGGYADLDGGAQVVLTDDRGETLSTGRLSAGEYDGLGCVFSFALEDVTRADFYGLSIAGGNRGQLQYSYEELSEADWSLQLSIGDD